MPESEFTRTMRERMGEGNFSGSREAGTGAVRSQMTVPSLSRSANDLLWEEMRDRLRTIQSQNVPKGHERVIQTAKDMVVQPTSGKSLIAIIVGGVLVLLGLIGLVK